MLPPAQVVKVDAHAPDDAVIDRAGAILASGGLVAIPTETVYGLAAMALDERAAQKIFEAKGRPSTNPLIVHVADVAAARAHSSQWPALADRLAEAFWPGPLTIVAPKSDRVPDVVSAGGPTVALRVPRHPVPLALLTRSGLSLAAPSANRSEGVSPTTADHVLADLGDRIDMILDAGPSTGGIESTVVELLPVPRVLRLGLVSVAEIEACLGMKVARPEGGAGVARSPGQHRRHYAPRAKTYVTDDPVTMLARFAQQGLTAAWIAFGEESTDAHHGPIARMPNRAVDYARELYSALRRLDGANVDVIVISRPPTGPEWEAIHDRLSRASTDE